MAYRPPNPMKNEFLNVCESKAKASAAFFEERIPRACTQISTQNFCFIVFYPYFCGVNQYIRTMQIITTREFRANQKKYFEMAETETILVSRRNAAPIMVCAVREGVFLQRKNLRPSREVLKISGTEIPSEWPRMSLWTIFLTV